ncbi:MAG: hypothetical protein RL033_4602 [Pseudomonadota bacterium]|jgi:hypothetical protein
MPIVILDALGRGEPRGSFLLDHVPRIAVRRDVKRIDEDLVAPGHCSLALQLQSVSGASCLDKGRMS